MTESKALVKFRGVDDVGEVFMLSMKNIDLSSNALTKQKKKILEGKKSFLTINLEKNTFYAYIFSFGSVRIHVLLLSYSGGIDLGIVHSCMYP